MKLEEYKSRVWKSKQIRPVRKYRNKKIKVDGITFDSKKESLYYLKLKGDQASGRIKSFEVKKRFQLLPSQREILKCKCGKNDSSETGVSICCGTMTEYGKVIERPVSYIADFVVHHLDGSSEVIDTKGFRSKTSGGLQVYILKRKMMLYFYKIKITEV